MACLFHRLCIYAHAWWRIYKKAETFSTIWTMKGIVWKYSCDWWSICLSITEAWIRHKVAIFSFMYFVCFINKSKFGWLVITTFFNNELHILCSIFKGLKIEVHFNHAILIVNYSLPPLFSFFRYQWQCARLQLENWSRQCVYQQHMM